jgi:spore germination protein
MLNPVQIFSSTYIEQSAKTTGSEKMQIYVIQSGDSLWQIAGRFGVTSEALQQLNQFPDPNRLVVGQAILIPTPTTIEPLSYTIVSGDTLYLLAQLFNTSIISLAKTNNLADPNLLSVGMTLLIPGWSAIRYNIRSGDTLYQIATRYGITLNQLIKVNQISTDAYIYPGQILLIPQPTAAAEKPVIESLAYFQLSNISALERSLTLISPQITYGALFHYPVNRNASMTISANTGRAVALLKHFQIRSLVVITNSTAGVGFDPDLARTVLGTDALREQLIGNILALLDHYGLEGVNVDFENMYPADRPLYTAFIQQLTSVLNANNYLVTIAVAPKAADLPSAAWVGAFDYAALGAAANLVYLMTYEWGWVGGPPMAIAPLNQVQQVIEYAASLIAPQKLIQGVPLYAYDWTLPDTPENVAATVNLNAVYDLAFNFNAAIEYNLTAQSPWFIYTNAAGSRHEVWFEDIRSVQAKYQLARDFTLGGVGFWSPVNEPYGFPQNWAVLAETFNVVK